MSEAYQTHIEELKNRWARALVGESALPDDEFFALIAQVGALDKVVLASEERSQASATLILAAFISANNRWYGRYDLNDLLKTALYPTA